MYAKEKSRSSAGTPERDMGAEENCKVAVYSVSEYSTVPLPRQVVDYLKSGRENAITAVALASVMGLSDARIVTRLIERARSSGIPICASVDAPWGFYLPADADELRRYLASYHRRLRTMQNTVQALEAVLDNATGQATLWGEEKDGTAQNSSER